MNVTFLPVILCMLLLVSCDSDSERNDKSLIDRSPKNIMSYYKLPAFELMNSQERVEIIDPLMVVKRFNALKMTPEDVTDFTKWKKLHEESTRAVNALTYPVIYFRGTTALELNTFLKSNQNKTVTLTNDLNVTEPIQMPSDILLDGGGFRLHAKSARVFLMSNINSSGIQNLQVEGDFQTAIYVTNGDNLLIKKVSISNGKGRPIVVMGDTHHFYLLDSVIKDNLIGGLYLRGSVSDVMIAGNTISNNHNASNFAAGIVLTHYAIEDINNPEQAAFQPIDHLFEFPHNILILNNKVADQQSSGIYLDGAVNIYILENSLLNNDKEGICLDNGTTATQFFNNTVIGNGRRIKQSDDDLKMDFVLSHGKMDDGSAKAKLPGISLDNALYNIIVENRISANYGSGVKMVRTGIRNIITHNTISDNNAGVNELFHFFGVELGSAKLDEPAVFLNAVGDYENIIASNDVRGPHYAGIFFAEDIYQNNVSENKISGASVFSIESISQRSNQVYNNVLDKPARGVANEQRHE
jgi:parallel beta-helix repeat protein